MLRLAAGEREQEDAEDAQMTLLLLCALCALLFELPTLNFWVSHRFEDYEPSN